MAIKPTNTNAGTTAQQAPQSTFSGGVMGLRSAFGAQIPRAAAGEKVQEYFLAIKSLLEKGEFESYRLHLLDNQASVTALSVIMLTTTGQASNGRTVVTCHSMIVEASGPRPNNQVVSVQGQTVEIYATPGDIANDPLWEKVKNEVALRYGGNIDVYDAGFSVIPAELDHTDVTHVRRVVSAAAEAAFRTLDAVLGGVVETFSINMVSKSERVVARLDYGLGGVETAAGLPVRSDLCIQLNGSAAGNSSDPWSVTSIDLTSVDGFMNLLFTRPNPPGYGMPPVTQHYVAEYVITQLASKLGAVTLELALLALHSATLLSKNMAWAGAFRPRNVRQGDVNLRDIGAIGYDVPALVGETKQGRKIDTSSAMFDLNKLHELLVVAVHPNILYSMDVEERGDNSWLDLVFLAAANRDPNSYNMIVQAANNLTDNRFGAAFRGGDIVVDSGNRIHMGYYIDGRTNSRRDIRDVDYLAMLNHVGETDMTLVAEFDRTYSETDRPLELRLKRRFDILQQVLGDSMRVKGYARRVTFTPAFLQALAESIQSNGFNITPANMQFDYGQNQRRGFDAIAGLAMNNANISGLFNPNQAAAGNGMPSVGYRFGRR